ncbi:hypothetical protein E4U55_004869 [Claviceps digitariae]|nr:hypothetical protein E4U55_004869 [Claviceps digitariae]
MSYPGAGPPPEGVTPDLAHPDDTLRTINYMTQALTVVIVTGFVATRVYAKSKVLGGGFTMDDYATYFAYVLLMSYCVIAVFASLYGGGLNMWEVPKGGIQDYFKACYAATIIYMPMVLSVKLALLIIIIRVFGTVHRKTLIGIYFLVGALCIYYGSGLFIKIFVCWPISAYWRGEASKCLNQGGIIIADSITSVVSDLAILLLPVPLTWSLQMPRKKRLRVSGMLCAGGIATGFSIYRLVLILSELKSLNQTIVFTKVILSGNAEIAIGLICACLPAVNTLYLQKTHGSSYLKQSSRSRRTASQAGEIVLTRSFHVDTSSLSNCETQSAVHDDLEMGSRRSRQHSQSELHYKYDHSRI